MAMGVEGGFALDMPVFCCSTGGLFCRRIEFVLCRRWRPGFVDGLRGEW
jgi:hypothetical protein